MNDLQENHQPKSQSTRQGTRQGADAALAITHSGVLCHKCGLLGQIGVYVLCVGHSKAGVKQCVCCNYKQLSLVYDPMTTQTVLTSHKKVLSLAYDS